MPFTACLLQTTARAGLSWELSLGGTAGWITAERIGHETVGLRGHIFYLGCMFLATTWQVISEMIEEVVDVAGIVGRLVRVAQAQILRLRGG